MSRPGSPRRGRGAACLAGLLSLLALSCSTIDQRVRVDPTGLDLPLSASASVILPGESAARGPAGLVILGKVDSRQEFSGRLSSPGFTLALAPLLGPEAARSGAAAITNLRISLEEFRVPLAAPIVLLRSAGAVASLAGGAILASGLSAGDLASYPAQTLSTGLYCLLPGLLSLGASYGLEALGTTQWKLRIEAELVGPRRN